MSNLNSSDFKSHVYMFIVLYRYNRDACWNGLQNLMHNTSMGQSTINKMRILGSNYSRIMDSSQGSSWKKDELKSFLDKEAWKGNYNHMDQLKTLKHQEKKSRIDHIQDLMITSSSNTNSSRLEKEGVRKRKAITESDEIDLTLSLRLGTKTEDEDSFGSQLEDSDNESISYLSLSLFSPSSSSKKIRRRMKEDEIIRENGKGASTLDLTL